MGIGTFFRDHLSLVLVLAIFLIIIIASWKYIFVAILALTLSVILLPIHKRWKKHLPAPLSAGIITTGVFVIIVGIILSVFFVLEGNISSLSVMLITIISFIGEIFNIPIGATESSSLMANFFDNIISSLLEAPSVLLEIVGDITTVVLGFVLLYVMLYLFIVMGEKLGEDVWSIIPEKSKESVALMGTKTKDILFSLYVVHVALAGLVFLLAIPYAWLLCLTGVITPDCILLIAVLCGILALIPMIGAIFLLVFMVLFSLAIGNIWGIIISATFGYFFLCILIDFILRPKITGKRVKIRPMLIFLGFFGGGAVMGVVGFVLGPILLVLGITAYDIFFSEMRKVKAQEMAEIQEQKAKEEALKAEDR